MFRHALDALRTATAPLIVSELTDAVGARKIADATATQRKGLEAGLRSCLERNAGKTVQRGKHKLRDCEVTYAELAKRLKKHDFKDETEAWITNKLARRTFAATWFLASLRRSNWMVLLWRRYRALLAYFKAQRA
jgi:hypothetical protein